MDLTFINYNAPIPFFRTKYEIIPNNLYLNFVVLDLLSHFSMKILLLSQDEKLIDFCLHFEQVSDHQIKLFNNSSKALDVIPFITHSIPSMIILDDDFTKPDSSELISSLKSINKNISVIFLTSNSSIDLGKKITPLGVSYYVIKPIDDNDLINSIESIIQHTSNKK